MKTRILALDVGARRIGVAVSDALNITAQGLETIVNKDNEYVINKVKLLVKEYDVEKIIVGIPINMDGSKGPGVKLSEEIAALLEKDLSIKVEMVDERLTTVQGERALLEADISRKKRKKFIDKLSAQLILQGYLDLQGN